jgi:glutamate dehydrogenase/leucine dehydrogenase
LSESLIFTDFWISQIIMKDITELPSDLAWIGVEGVKFVQGNFDKGGFDTGAGVEVWASRKRETSRSAGKNVLSDRRHLRNGIRYDVQGDTVQVGVDGKKLPYAKLHNEGGTVEITDKQRGFFWYQYGIHSKKLQGKRKGKDNEKKLTQTEQKISEEAEMWKRMALAKGPLKFPKRKFLDVSPALWSAVNAELKDRLDNIFKKYRL